MGMKPDTARKIVSLNHQFYQSFADDFSETRGRLQMGVLKILDRIPEKASVLDLGCGNGKVVTQLDKGDFKGTYLGADFSAGLLNRAAADIPTTFKVNFLELDLTAPSWENVLPPTKFEVILCFATFHHIPSHHLRVSLCHNIRQFLAEEGILYISAWQFVRSERLRKKILPWDTVNISAGEVDEGDYLLDWQRGGSGTRYVHLFSPEELSLLAESSGFKIIESFNSDGEGGNLGLYQVWKAV
jgi:SAM-dependent methyltransferase